MPHATSAWRGCPTPGSSWLMMVSRHRWCSSSSPSCCSLPASCVTTSSSCAASVDPSATGTAAGPSFVSARTAGASLSVAPASPPTPSSAPSPPPDATPSALAPPVPPACVLGFARLTGSSGSITYASSSVSALTWSSAGGTSLQVACVRRHSSTLQQ